MAEREQYHSQCDWKIDEKHGSPRNMLDSPSAENRTQSRSDRAEAGPYSNGASAFLLGERIADDRKAARDKKCRAESLKRAGRDQLVNVPGETACCRCNREDHNTEQKDATAAVMIA